MTKAKKKASELCELRLNTDRNIRTCHVIAEKKEKEFANYPPKDPLCGRNCPQVENRVSEIGRRNPVWSHCLTTSWATLPNSHTHEVCHYVGKMVKAILVVDWDQILCDQEIDVYIVF